MEERQNCATTSLTPIQSILGISPDMQAILARNKAHREAIKPRLLEQYGFSELTDGQIIELERAEKELAECEGCTGTCLKKRAQYFQPVIGKKENGELWLAAARCKFGEIRAIRSQCGKSFIPLKYAQKKFADYEVTADNSNAVNGAKWFVREKPDRGLYLYGGYGTGKTFLASIIAREFVLDFKSVIFGDVPSLMQTIKATFDGKTQDNAQDVLERYSTCDLLVLDDLGAGQITPWNVAQLYQVINSRYNSGLPIVVTSNHSVKDLQNRLSIADDSTAARITSRLREMTHQLFLGVNDRRKLS